jgi:hypothetical protein
MVRPSHTSCKGMPRMPRMPRMPSNTQFVKEVGGLVFGVIVVGNIFCASYEVSGLLQAHIKKKLEALAPSK